jgi:hypothetical protein
LFFGQRKRRSGLVGVSLFSTRAPDVVENNINARRTVAPAQDGFRLSKSVLKPMSMFIKITYSHATVHIAWRLLHA